MQSHRVVTSVDKAADDKELQRAADPTCQLVWTDLSVGQSDVLPAVHLENGSWWKLSLVFAKFVCWDMFKTAQYKSLFGAL